MKRLLIILAVLAAFALATDASAASKSTTCWISYDMNGIATNLFAPLSKYGADLEGDLNTHVVGSLERIVFMPKHVLLSGASQFPCELGEIVTCDQVVLMPICEPCIYLWTGTHYIHDSANRCVDGTLYSVGLAIRDRDGYFHLDIDYYGVVVITDQVPVEGPGLSDD